MGKPFGSAAAVATAAAVLLVSAPSYADSPIDPVYCDNSFSEFPSSVETRAIPAAQIAQEFPEYAYSDELISTNRVTSAFYQRTVTWTKEGFRQVDEVTGLSDWICHDVQKFSDWTGPYIAEGSPAPSPVRDSKFCLKSYKMELAGPLQPDLSLMPGVTDGFTIDEPALLTRSSNSRSKETSFGSDPSTGWLDCINDPDYNKVNPKFANAVVSTTLGNIDAKVKTRLMAYQGRYRVASAVLGTTVTYRIYPSHEAYGSLSGSTVRLGKDSEVDTKSVSNTWFLRDCRANDLRVGQLLPGDNDPSSSPKPFAQFVPRDGLPLTLTEEAEWMKANCPDPVAPTTTGVNSSLVGPPLECRVVSATDPDVNVIASPIYRSRDAVSNAYLGAFRGFSDWIAPTTTDSVFEIKADNKFVWADFLRYGNVEAGVVGDAAEVLNTRKWSTFMGLSTADGQNSPSLQGTLTEGGPGPNDAGQPYHVAKQPIDADGEYATVSYGSGVVSGGRTVVGKAYDRLVLGSWYGPTSVLDYDEAKSNFYPGLMVAFGAASAPGDFWGVRPAWAVSAAVRYTKEMSTGVRLEASAANSVLVYLGKDTLNDSVTEVLFSDSCTAARQARFHVTAPAITN